MHHADGDETRSRSTNKRFSDDLRTLNRITGRDLEVVDTSGLVNTP
jgi:hypothetical protein